MIFKFQYTFLLLLFSFLTVLKRKRDGEPLDEDIEWIQKMYEVKCVKTVSLQRFDTEGLDYKLVIRDELFKENMTLDETLHYLYYVMQGILNDILGHLPDETYARVVILSPDFNINETDVPISTSMQKKEYITPELIFARIENIVQSKKRFLIENDMTIHVIHTKIPAGMGRKKNCLQLKDKKSVISVCEENDSLCLARSIVIGQTAIDSGTFIYIHIYIAFNRYQHFHFYTIYHTTIYPSVEYEHSASNKRPVSQKKWLAKHINARAFIHDTTAFHIHLYKRHS